MDGVSQAGSFQQSFHQLMYVLGIGVHTHVDACCFRGYPVKPIGSLLLHLLQHFGQRAVVRCYLLCGYLATQSQQHAQSYQDILFHS